MGGILNKILSLRTRLPRVAIQAQIKTDNNQAFGLDGWIAAPTASNDIPHLVIASQRRGNPDYSSLEAWRVSDLICAWIATRGKRVRNDVFLEKYRYQCAA